MRGVAGKPGWFWLFLLEGILTFLIGFAVNPPITKFLFSVALGFYWRLTAPPAYILGSIELSIPPLFADKDHRGFLA